MMGDNQPTMLKLSIAVAITCLWKLTLTTALTFQYFSYGSNCYSPTMTDLRQIQCIASTAAVLPDHKLRFNIPGIPAVEPSYASVEECRHEMVHGVLYTLTPQDFARLSLSEGVPLGYQWKVVSVVPYQGDGERAGQRAVLKSQTSSDATKTAKAYTLVTNNPFLRWRPDIPPSRAYRNLLIQGARAYQMDQDYVNKLEATPTGFTLIGDGFVAGNVLEGAERNARRKELRQ